MRIVFHTNSLSPHQLPLAKELVKLVGADNYRYVYTNPMTDERAKLGWGVEDIDWVIYEREAPAICRRMLEECDVLISGLRETDLFERRALRGLKTFYCGERWFKPFSFGVGSWFRCSMAGPLRLLVPSYRKMVRRFVRIVNESACVRVLPYGVWAQRDFLRLGMAANKMTVIGYCVEPSSSPKTRSDSGRRRKVLWAGRLIRWKRVDTIVRAARLCPGVDFTLIGRGPLRSRVMQFMDGLDNVRLLDAVPIAEVRRQMREHDIYVLSSNAEEGWGAALNEALEEGMKVVGTYEAGSSATILPESCLFHAGDYKHLAELLLGDLPRIDIGRWSSKKMAQALMDLIKDSAR